MSWEIFLLFPFFCLFSQVMALHKPQIKVWGIYEGLYLASLNSSFSSVLSDCQNICSLAFQPLSNSTLLGFCVSHPGRIQLRSNQMTQGETAHRMLGSILCRFLFSAQRPFQSQLFYSSKFQLFVSLSQRSCQTSKVLSFLPMCHIPRGESSNECRIHLNYVLSLGSQPFKSWLSRLFSNDSVKVFVCLFTLHFYPAFRVSVIRKTSLVRATPSQLELEVTGQSSKIDNLAASPPTLIISHLGTNRSFAEIRSLCPSQGQDERLCLNLLTPVIVHLLGVIFMVYWCCLINRAIHRA